MNISVREVAAIVESFAPLSYQEDYDNSGLLVGNPDAIVTSALVCIDVTEQVMEEAISGKHGLIISHHPLIFKGLKTITNRTATERIVSLAIKNDIAIYAAHTNLDSVFGGVSSRICDKLGLQHCSILSPLQNRLAKVVCFVPAAHAEAVRNAMFAANAGHIGNYDCCSYNLSGQGTFRANENANPFVGKKGELHTEEEVRVETIVQRQHLSKLIKALIEAHPYEEPAYDIYPLENTYQQAGLGMVGSLPNPVKVDDFLQLLKTTFKTGSIRYTHPLSDTLQRVAVCGGSGFSLMRDAISARADIFVTADIKYHQFFEPEGRIMLADIGHYESEQFTVDIICELLREKIPTFVTQMSKRSTNPINYI